MLQDDNKLKHMRKLGVRIMYHSYCYFVHDNPEISDAEFDKLVIELQEYNTEYPQYKHEYCITERVGSANECDYPGMIRGMYYYAHPDKLNEPGREDSYYKQVKERNDKIISILSHCPSQVSWPTDQLYCNTDKCEYHPNLNHHDYERINDEYCRLSRELGHGLGKTMHMYRMYSLDKAHTEAEVIAWASKIENILRSDK